MTRTAFIVALLSSVPTLADEEEPLPSAAFSAEAQVVKVTLQPSDAKNGVEWVELMLRVTRCIAGPCIVHQSVKVKAPVSRLWGRHGDTMGVIGYEWKDKAGQPHAWALALRLDDEDQKDRFDRESEVAVANVGAPSDGSAVATR